MAEATVKKRGAGGRPSSGREGEVDSRIIEAATRLFLKAGYEATSCEQVALDAKAGKASIYTRYANKAALFAAVIDHKLGALAAGVGTSAAPAQSPRQRLAGAICQLLENALQADTVAMIRLIMAEQPRFGVMGLSADELWRRLGVQRIANIIAPPAADEAAALRALHMAHGLADLVVAPCLLRAMLGEDGDALMQTGRARIEQSIDRIVADGQLKI